MKQGLVPQEVRKLVGSAMKPETLAFLWVTPLTAFENNTPVDVWRVDQQRVIAYIETRKRNSAA